MQNRPINLEEVQSLLEKGIASVNKIKNVEMQKNMIEILDTLKKENTEENLQRLKKLIGKGKKFQPSFFSLENKDKHEFQELLTTIEDTLNKDKTDGFAALSKALKNILEKKKQEITERMTPPAGTKL